MHIIYVNKYHTNIYTLSFFNRALKGKLFDIKKVHLEYGFYRYFFDVKALRVLKNILSKKCSNVFLLNIHGLFLYKDALNEYWRSAQGFLALFTQQHFAYFNLSGVGYLPLNQWCIKLVLLGIFSMLFLLGVCYQLYDQLNRLLPYQYAAPYLIQPLLNNRTVLLDKAIRVFKQEGLLIKKIELMPQAIRIVYKSEKAYLSKVEDIVKQLNMSGMASSITSVTQRSYIDLHQ